MTQPRGRAAGGQTPRTAHAGGALGGQRQVSFPVPSQQSCRRWRLPRVHQNEGKRAPGGAADAVTLCTTKAVTADAAHCAERGEQEGEADHAHGTCPWKRGEQAGGRWLPLRPGPAAAALTTVGLPLLMSWLTSWKMLLQSMDLSSEPRFTITATASRICSRTYFWRLRNTTIEVRRHTPNAQHPQVPPCARRPEQHAHTGVQRSLLVMHRPRARRPGCESTPTINWLSDPP